MTNLFFISKRALIVLMTNCFLSQSVSIFWCSSEVILLCVLLHVSNLSAWNLKQFAKQLSVFFQFEWLTGTFSITHVKLGQLNMTLFHSRKMFKTSFDNVDVTRIRNDLKRDPSTSVSFPSIDDIRDSPFDDRRFLLNNQYKVYFTLLGKYYEIMIVKHIILDMSFAAVKETQRSSLSSTLRIINRGKYWSYDYPLLGPMPPSGRRT